jgi:hypothetical protein
VKECTSALELAPANPKALQRRARSLEQQGMYKQALADIQAVNRWGGGRGGGRGRGYGGKGCGGGGGNSRRIGRHSAAKRRLPARLWRPLLHPLIPRKV